MPVFSVSPKNDGTAPRVWIDAHSILEARRLISLNVLTHAEALDETLFDCTEDETHTPPVGVILTDDGRTFPVQIM